MNQALRWKRFIEWWDDLQTFGLSGEELADIVDQKLDELRGKDGS